MTPSILIVEDDIIVSESIAEDLKRENYKVLGQCDSGASVLELIEERLPDLVLMDIKLKGVIDGIQIAEHIQKNYHIPIIYLTDAIDFDTFKKAKSTSPVNYLTKPFQTHQLLMAIELALNVEKTAINTAFGFFRNTDKEEVKVNYQDILYLKSEKVYCHVVLKDKSFLISQPMGTIHKRIPFKDIIRVAKSYCINRNHVDKIIGNTVLIGNERITVGEKYRQILKEFNFIK